jgi:hypothetical protein
MSDQRSHSICGNLFLSGRDIPLSNCLAHSVAFVAVKADLLKYPTMTGGVSCSANQYRRLCGQLDMILALSHAIGGG